MAGTTYLSLITDLTVEEERSKAAIAFALLATASIGSYLPLVKPGIFIMGLGMGIFTVGGLALMMDLTVKEQVGLFREMIISRR